VIPLQDILPTRSAPVATLTLIAINVAIFVLDRWAPAVMPLELTNAPDSILLHPGLAALLVNVMFLWLFGDNVEDQTGRTRFVILYAASGLSAALAEVLIYPGASRSLIGASGAVTGVIGAYFVLFPRSRILVFFPIAPVLHELPAALFLLIWFLVQLVTLAAQADLGPGLGAHGVAFVTGAVCCLALRRPERARVEWWGDAGSGRSGRSGRSGGSGGTF
jgi:membrane associated rhomboid family serine protease